MATLACSFSCASFQSRHSSPPPPFTSCKQVVKVRAESMAAAAQQGKPHGMLSGAQRGVVRGWLGQCNGVLPRCNAGSDQLLLMNASALMVSLDCIHASPSSSPPSLQWWA